MQTFEEPKVNTTRSTRSWLLRAAIVLSFSCSESAEIPTAPTDPPSQHLRSVELRWDTSGLVTERGAGNLDS
jgi:hypothetical protein